MIRNVKKVIIISIILFISVLNPLYSSLFLKKSQHVFEDNSNKKIKSSASVSMLWSYTTGDDIYSSAALGDIDGDGKLEVIVGSHDDNLYALNGEDGSECWVYETGGVVGSDPALGDIDNDGKLEVIVGSWDHNVYALNGEDGSECWVHETGDGISSSPSLGDIDNDGKLEVVVGSRDTKIYALNGENGNELWSYATGDYIYSSAALGDIDGDKKLEVITGNRDGQCFALNGENGTVLWTFTMYYDLFQTYSLSSSAVVGDVDEDGKLEVIIGGRGPHYDSALYALNGEDGTLLWTYKSTYEENLYISGEHTVALVDIDFDSKLEIVVGNRTVLSGENGNIVWRYENRNPLCSSPSIGDVDGDGKLEIVVGSYDNKVYAANCENGTESWSYETGDNIYATPVLGDLDGDGNLEVVVGSWDNKIYALNPEPSGQGVYWQGFSGDCDFYRRRNHEDVITLPPLDFDVLFSWSTICRFKNIASELRISIIKSTQKNDNILSNWNVIPDENYNFKFGLLIELSNIDSALEFYGAPQFITDLCNKFLLSEDGALRIFLSLNIIKAYANWTLIKFASNIKTIFLTFIKLGLHPNRKVSLDVAFRWLIENPIGERYFDIVRGTNQYQLKLVPSALSNPIWSILKVIDIFARGDFYILNINSQNVSSIRISSHEIVKARYFIIDIWRLFTKCSRVIASAGADVAAWIQGGASAYKIFHRVIFDPPSILESILNRIFPDYSSKIEEIFGEFKEISNGLYLFASFIDPPTSRLDLGVFDSNGKLLLGYNKTNDHLIYSSDIGFLAGDENGQFMFLNFSKINSLNFSVINTDLNGYLDKPLNFTLIVKQINSDNIWISGGTLLDNTTTSTLIECSDNNFTISTLHCKVIEDKYPNIKFQVFDINENPIEVDKLTLHLNEQQLIIESIYLGNGTYLIKKIPTAYNQNDIFSLILEKKSYLMSQTEIILSNFPKAPYLTISTPSPTTSFEIELSWTASKWASNYTLYRHTIPINSSNLYSATEIKTIQELATYDMVPGLNRWYYAVTANNATGSSEPSNCLYIDVQEESIGGREVIPGYNILILIGAICFISTVLLKKRRK